ncbi:MAG TPA: hypothetical protein VN823_16430 [Stellaceae bacterium]|nr:hypothetical protein [Stellaceae bacterium]
MTDPQSSAFDDADQLDALLNDAKASDTISVSSASDARDLIGNFGAETAASPWTSLERSAVAQRLAAIVSDPRQVQQGALNLCGPAAFFSQWAKRDPVAFATFATQLYDAGAAKIGSLQISPGQDLLQASYADMVPRMGGSVSPPADWMILGALRNSTDVFWQGSWEGDPGQNLAALTRPEELASWFNATGIYAKVDNQANWATAAGIPHALSLALRPGVDIALLIHANLMATSLNKPYDANWLKSQFPNHFVVLLGDVVQDVQTKNMTLSVWSWGGVKPLVVSQDDFVANYYGAVIARMPDQ